jgi:acyl-CoA thioesterase-2
MSVEADLVGTLTLVACGDDLFRGTSPTGQRRVAGGQVIAQSLLAAYETVAPDRSCHSLHCHFVHPGRSDLPIDLAVERTRDGGSFTTRRVVARQGEAILLECIASFQTPANGCEHQQPMPEAEAVPEALGDEGDPRGLHLGIQSRNVRSPRPGIVAEVRPPLHQAWLRVLSPLGEQRFHQAALAYATDLHMLPTMIQPHPLTWSMPGMRMASLDHTLWFHRPFDMNDWLLHSLDSPFAGGGRGLARGLVYDRGGTLVASTAQEAIFGIKPAV